MLLSQKRMRRLPGSGPIILLTLLLTACGGESETSGESTAADFAAEYKAEVDKQISESVVNSLVREWGILEKQARCLLGDLRASQLGRVDSDPAVQAVFEKCGVDPSVVDSKG